MRRAEPAVAAEVTVTQSYVAHRSRRENAHFGARVIKIVVDDQPYIYSADDIKYMIEEAARAGLKLAAHCVTQQGARNAAEAGVASIEHGFEMSNETLELAKKNNVVLVSTDFTEKAWLAYGMPDAVAKRFHERGVDRLRRAYKIGVTLAFGSDLIFYAPDETRGTWTMSLIDVFVEAGIPAKDILQALIPNAARLLGVEKVRGAISPGQFADIIAVPENGFGMYGRRFGAYLCDLFAVQPARCFDGFEGANVLLEGVCPARWKRKRESPSYERLSLSS